MIIETKFNKGDIVYFILNNKIVKFPIFDLEYSGGIVIYKIQLKKSQTIGLDSDEYCKIYEEDVYKNIDDLANKYKEILDK